MSIHKEEKIVYNGDQATRVTWVKTDDLGEIRLATGLYVDDCAYCEGERDQESTFFPSHWPSSMCQSGKRPHCTCDSCF